MSLSELRMYYKIYIYFMGWNRVLDSQGLKLAAMHTSSVIKMCYNE